MKEKQFDSKSYFEEGSIVPLCFGHQLMIEKEDKLEICSAQGESIIIKLSESGIEIEAKGNKLKLTANEEIELSAPKIKLNAEKDLRLISKGNLITHAGKDSLLECNGINKTIATDQKLIATQGNVEIKANDDVKVDGERLFLNCDQ